MPSFKRDENEATWSPLFSERKALLLLHWFPIKYKTAFKSIIRFLRPEILIYYGKLFRCYYADVRT